MKLNILHRKERREHKCTGCRTRAHTAKLRTMHAEACTRTHAHPHAYTANDCGELVIDGRVNCSISFARGYVSLNSTHHCDSP